MDLNSTQLAKSNASDGTDKSPDSTKSPSPDTKSNQSDDTGNLPPDSKSLSPGDVKSIWDMLSSINDSIKSQNAAIESQNAAIVTIQKQNDDAIVTIQKQNDKIMDSLAALEKRTAVVEKRTGILVEEKGRVHAARLFGTDFSRSFVIRSLHDVVKLISRSDTSSLAKRDGLANGDMESRIRAAGKIANKLKPLVPAFAESAIKSVKQVFSTNPLFKRYVAEKEIICGILDNVRADTGSTNLASNMGELIGLVKKMCDAEEKVSSSKEAKPSDIEEAERRVKIMTRFQRKLARIQKAVKSDEELSKCNGPGVLFLAVLALAKSNGYTGNGENSSWSEWIKSGKCDVFDYKEEIECVLRPRVEIVEDYATITVAEIKSSIDEYPKASEQMLYQVQVLEYGLKLIFGEKSPKDIIKEGHLIFWEGSDNDQRRSAEISKHGMSIFVHQATSD